LLGLTAEALQRHLSGVALEKLRELEDAGMVTKSLVFRNQIV
jgi:hypothetical protein